MQQDILASETHPDDPGRYSYRDGVGWQVINDDRACGDHRPATDAHAGENDGSVTDPDVVFNVRVPVDATPRIAYRLTNNVSAVIRAPDESYVPSHQDIATKGYVALNR